MPFRTTAGSDRISTQEACAHLSFSRTTLYQILARDKTFPTPYRLSARDLRWSRAELDAWMESKRAA